MHIVVLIKQVPGTDNVKMDPETGVMVRTNKNNVINPLDENALEEAIRIKNSLPGTKVTAISMGPESAIKALREAIAMGADQAVLISGRAFAGSDTIATARVLSAAIRKVGPADIILCGERATDGETGQTGAMVAAMLDIPVQSYVSKIDIECTEEGNRVTVNRIVEGGFEVVSVPCPVLITVVKDINIPGLPTINGKIKARQTDIPVWGPEDLGLEKPQLGLTGSPTRVVKIFSPKLARNTVMFQEDGSGNSVQQLLEFFRQRELI
ncbi:MAG: electron transfer flavoprotein subunit beta/FixA family protein [Bacillota bacterium]|uniref:electron transfer flavoprotein subunit beta/FixA family protein n=1 Tax=Desulfurispora thermophila TaxID=265470 RepID=UPI000366CC33|nr:electron transfer flavoprotein subunit beta/FixA family protein [Desulfurispora thermophila]